MGLHLELLTGDTQQAAAELARQAPFDQVSGGMLPEDKLRRVEELIAQHKIVAMIGDGINDAPALARAQVGVAMGSGTAVARESADVVLIGSDLRKFCRDGPGSKKMPVHHLPEFLRHAYRGCDWHSDGESGLP